MTSLAGDTGLICSFGAGYSAGTVFVRKAALSAAPVSLVRRGRNT